MEKEKAVELDIKYIDKKSYSKSDIEYHINYINDTDDEYVSKAKEIFKIILKNEEKYSKNNDWILINFGKLKKITKDEIIDYINYCIYNDHIIENEEIERSNYKNLLTDNSQN